MEGYFIGYRQNGQSIAQSKPLAIIRKGKPGLLQAPKEKMTDFFSTEEMNLNFDWYCFWLQGSPPLLLSVWDEYIRLSVDGDEKRAAKNKAIS